jgi:hypothetical protein
MEKLKPVKYFEDNGYIKIENFITPSESFFLYNYIKLMAIKLNWFEENFTELSNDIYDNHGTFNDPQAPGDYSKYGDPIFDTLLSLKLKEVEYFTGLNLLPNYSYHRLYTTNTELKKHIDRFSCEISTTLCLGYDVSNIDAEKYPDYNWPMFIKEKNGKELPVHMKPGDMIIYRGCELEHWREPFLGMNHAQVFLHYNEIKNGENILFDGRPVLGLPSGYKIEK